MRYGSQGKTVLGEGSRLKNATEKQVRALKSHWMRTWRASVILSRIVLMQVSGQNPEL